MVGTGCFWVFLLSLCLCVLSRCLCVSCRKVCIPPEDKMGKCTCVHLCVHGQTLAAVWRLLPVPFGASCPLLALLRQCLADQREASTEHTKRSKSWEMVRIKFLLLVTLVGLSLCQVSSCTLSFSHRLTTAWWQQLYKNLTTAPKQLDDCSKTAWRQLDNSFVTVKYFRYPRQLILTKLELTFSLILTLTLTIDIDIAIDIGMDVLSKSRHWASPRILWLNLAANRHRHWH